MALSRKRKAERPVDDMELPKFGKSKGKGKRKRGLFASREHLSTALKGYLEESIDDSNDLITFNKEWLERARKSKREVDIRHAAAALEKSLQRKTDLLVRLMEKLESMEDMRRAEESAKPVTLILRSGMELVNVVATVPFDLATLDG